MKREVRLRHSRCVCEKLQRSPSTIQHTGRAFTVIELVGVLAIIAILAAALAPNIIKRIDRAAWQRETSDLNTMANGFVHTVLKDKQIANQTGIPASIAKYLDLSVGQVTTTPRGITRIFMVDPAITIDTKVGPATVLPYTQGPAGSATKPANVRVLILSAIGGPPLSTITNNNDFTALWSLPENMTPQGWTGKSDDFLIQRVDLSPSFWRIHLLNLDQNHDGWYAIDPQNAMNAVSHYAGYTTLDAYVMDGAALSLYETESNPRLQIRTIIHQDESYVYQNDRWSRSLSPDQLSPDLDEGTFGWLVNEFLKPPFPDAKFLATQQAVIDEMYTYMWSYVLWAEGDSVHPPFEGWTDNAGAPNYPYYSVIPSSATRLGVFTDNLVQPR